MSRNPMPDLAFYFAVQVAFRTRKPKTRKEFMRGAKEIRFIPDLIGIVTSASAYSAFERWFFENEEEFVINKTWELME